MSDFIYNGMKREDLLYMQTATRGTVSQALLAMLVDWAENVLVEGGFPPDEDVILLRGIVAYRAAADTTAFPLTWEHCAQFMRQLSSPVRVVTAL